MIPPAKRQHVVCIIDGKHLSTLQANVLPPLNYYKWLEICINFVSAINQPLNNTILLHFFNEILTPARESIHFKNTNSNDVFYFHDFMGLNILNFGDFMNLTLGLGHHWTLHLTCSSPLSRIFLPFPLVFFLVFSSPLNAVSCVD